MCPLCKNEGTPVKGITVRHMIYDEVFEQFKDISYYVCMNKKCNVVYFNLESNITFKKSHIKIPIGFKEDANPKYICYCNKVTEDQIVDAVISKGAKNIKDIIKLTGAMKNGKCETNNPLGKCCSSAIEEAISKAINMK